MKIKILKINTCHDCKHAMLFHEDGYCRLEGRDFSYDNGAKIPVWCPLEDEGDADSLLLRKIEKLIE